MRTAEPVCDRILADRIRSVTRFNSAFRRRISSAWESTDLRSSSQAYLSALSRCTGCECPPQARRDFARRVTALRHLLDRCDFEFLCIPLSTYIFP
jgi:hypothetical protein